MWPLQWYHQGPANKLCWLIYAEPLWLIGFTMRENRVSCNRNSEWCELFRIWLMNWKIHISSLNPHCVSMFTSNTHWEWEDDLAALAQHSTEALISRKNIYFVPTPSTLISMRQHYDTHYFLCTFVFSALVMYLLTPLSVSLAMHDMLWQWRENSFLNVAIVVILCHWQQQQC